ncbi:MAG TPA: hypothetical protein PKZ39_01530 [Clostridia bacterium]|nr:hypothetical protein [Clostridia bacterium]
MYRPQSKQVSVFENENLFRFQGLNPDNDWVRLSRLIPLAELERRYAQTFDSKLRNAGKPARMGHWARSSSRNDTGFQMRIRYRRSG